MTTRDPNHHISHKLITHNHTCITNADNLPLCDFVYTCPRIGNTSVYLSSTPKMLIILELFTVVSVTTEINYNDMVVFSSEMNLRNKGMPLPMNASIPCTSCVRHG